MSRHPDIRAEGLLDTPPPDGFVRLVVGVDIRKELLEDVEGDGRDGLARIVSDDLRKRAYRMVMERTS